MNDLEVQSLFNSIQNLDKISLATHIPIQKFESLWPLLNKTGILSEQTRNIVNIAFDHGGFIAGGFGRWAATSNRTPVERGSYVAHRGDIDIFFYTKEGLKAFLETLKSSNIAVSYSRSQAGFAINIEQKINRSEFHKHNVAPIIQAIGCVTGNPEDVLRTFDFVNCMFAFTKNESYVAQAALQLEKERILGISSWSHRGLVHRLTKYLTKYGYLTIKDMSHGQRLNHLCDVAGRFNLEADSHHNAIFWTQFLQRYDTFFENTDVIDDILTCCILPSDTSGKKINQYFNSKHQFRSALHNPIGNYEFGVTQLHIREQKAKIRELFLKDNPNYEDNENIRYLSVNIDPPSWTAENYCWSA